MSYRESDQFEMTSVHCLPYWEARCTPALHCLPRPRRSLARSSGECPLQGLRAHSRCTALGRIAGRCLSIQILRIRILESLLILDQTLLLEYYLESTNGQFAY